MFGTPARFPSGVTNVGRGDPLGLLGMPDPTKYHVFFDDFNRYLASDWTVTETQAGATQALAGGAGGILLLTNTTADNDINQLQNAIACNTIASGKKLFMKARFKLNEVIESDFAIGLQLPNVDGTTLATATDGIFFLKADGAATLGVYYRRDNTTGSSHATGIATLVDDTYVTVAAYFDGGTSLKYFVNDVHLGTLDAAATSMPNTDLAPIISLKQGEATNAKTAKIDYIFIAQER